MTHAESQESLGRMRSARDRPDDPSGDRAKAGWITAVVLVVIVTLGLGGYNAWAARTASSAAKAAAQEAAQGVSGIRVLLTNGRTTSAEDAARAASAAKEARQLAAQSERVVTTELADNHASSLYNRAILCAIATSLYPANVVIRSHCASGAS